MRAALIQLSVSDDPADNLPATEAALREAAAGGAELAATPEMTNLVSGSRTHQMAVARAEADDPTLARLRAVAAELGLWLVIGSLAVRSERDPDRLANRCFVIDPAGDIRARYDKIHMFDVTVSETETYRESETYAPGNRAVVVDTPFGRLGLSICYDLRFPVLYRVLARAGAEILMIPAAFTRPTGQAHWHTLLRARAIETGSFVLAPAQTGEHRVAQGRPRQTYGHALAVSPWGEVLADAGTGPGVTFIDLDLDEVARARARIPAIAASPDWVLADD
jgi:predicted amidohydrolase